MTQGSKEQQRLIKLCEKLDRTIGEIVQVAAVSGPLTRTDLIDLAAKAGVKHEDGSVPTYKNNRDAINAAISSGVLEYVGSSNAGPVQVAILLEDHVFRQALSGGLAERVRKQIEGQPKRSYGHVININEHEAIRNMRFAFYSDEFEKFR